LERKSYVFISRFRFRFRFSRFRFRFSRFRFRFSRFRFRFRSRSRFRFRSRFCRFRLLLYGSGSNNSAPSDGIWIQRAKPVRIWIL